MCHFSATFPRPARLHPFPLACFSSLVMRRSVPGFAEHLFLQIVTTDG